MGTFFQAFAQADFFGKLIFFGLFCLSFICWVFLIQKIWTFKKTKRQARRFQKAIVQHKESLLNLDVPKHSLRERPYPRPFHTLFAALKEKTTEILDKNNFFLLQTKSTSANYLSKTDVEMIDSHLQSTIAKQRETLEKNLFILSTTVTLAPFLGLLGTVWGILITFGELQAGHSVTSNTVILGGLSTALTTTVLGLLIAIPALIAYSYLRNSSRHFTTEMHDFSQFLLSTVELQYRKVDLG